MAAFKVLDILQIFHQELLAICEGRSEGTAAVEQELPQSIFENELRKIWERPRKRDESRKKINSGTVDIDGNDYSINEEFRRTALMLSDELDLDEIEAVKYLLDAQEDPPVVGRPLIECAIIRFHQQRMFALDCLRLLLEIQSLEDEDDSQKFEALILYVENRLFLQLQSGSRRFVPKCMDALGAIKTWAQTLGDKLSAAKSLPQDLSGGFYEELETIEVARVNLLRQHEALGVILCRAVERRLGESCDFIELISILKKLDRYDVMLVHLLPAVGAFISLYGSTEGGHDLIEVRNLSSKLSPELDESAWPLPYFQASIRAWWLAEYSGFYLDDPPESAIPPTTDLDREDRERTAQFLETLKDGAFDFMLSVAGDVKQQDWHDPVRAGMRKWLQRSSPALAVEATPFSDFFQMNLMAQLEIFVDAFISNLPDVLRRLRIEEDEQRQLSQTHEQDLDLEKFLLIIAYSYEGRPEAATNFWSDPDSNLAGFMHWASKRASTPLVTAFCEMLQAISSGDENATAAHEFLLDEGHHSSGKMSRTQSLTWSQIFKELDFFSEKVRQKPTSTTNSRYRGGKPGTDQVEVEPESAMMLECYLRLVTTLSTESETTRQFLLQNQYHIEPVLFELASSHIPHQLRGCIFTALRSLLTRKTLAESHSMWTHLDAWLAGSYAGITASQQRQTQQNSLASMDRIFDEISSGFEDPWSFVQLLTALISPATDSSPLNDNFSFPETLGSTVRVPGVEIYVDFVMGRVFAAKNSDISDIHQLRELRLACLDFIWTCLNTFNEDLIIMANSTNMVVDSIIATNSLATYVVTHPFVRVMEWMYNGNLIAAILNTVSHPLSEIVNARHDSSLMCSIQRGIDVISKVMDLQATYLDIVRPIVVKKSGTRRQPVTDTAYASFEDGLVTKKGLVVDLGSYCAIGNPDLTLVSLKLLERMSSSPTITSIWSGTGPYVQQNKAIVAMEANGEHEFISRSFISQLSAPLEVGREADSPQYLTKIYILDFLYSCLRQTPRKPTIAHLLLGFKCSASSLSIEPSGAFAGQNALFHTLLKLLLDNMLEDTSDVRQWTITIKSRIMQIFRVLWTSPLSSPFIIKELRDNEFLFHLLVGGNVIQPDLSWEGQNVSALDFPITDGALTLLNFFTLRNLIFEYIAMELCLISQGRMPSVKRRIFEGLNGQILGDDNQAIQTPTVFDLFDFLLPSNLWTLPEPQVQFHTGLDLSSCEVSDEDGNSIYNIQRVEEVFLLKRNEFQKGTVLAANDLANIEAEESMILAYLLSCNRQKQIGTQALKVLQSWTNLLLVMIECNDFKGAAQTSFFLQALQAILPSLEAFASERTREAYELAKLANMLLFKLHEAVTSAPDTTTEAVGHLIGDKLFQLFEICTQAIGKWSGTSALRAVFYEICFRYLACISQDGPLSSVWSKTVKTVRLFGDRLANVVCDDAYAGIPASQTAALIFLNSLIALGRQEDDSFIVDTLNKLNFIGILVDSLRNITQEWHEASQSNRQDQQHFQNARLALLLQLCQTRAGAKNVLHANLFRTVETCGLFSADPELQSNTEDARALEDHYDLLGKVVRIIGAAVLMRGSHNMEQGRKFIANHRMLVVHTLKRSAGLGGSSKGNEGLDDKVAELADGFMVLIAATEFLEHEEGALPQPKQQRHVSFH